MNDGLNYEAWARNAIAFIRERGLEGEFSDWCGGWPVPVKATTPMIAAAPLLLEALERITAFADAPAETPVGPVKASDMARQSAMQFGIFLIQELPSIRAAISSARGGQ